MAKNNLPLEEVSVEELFNGSEKRTYEIPIYQRNYAWEKDEITALVQDVYDAYIKDRNRPYYIGTLVSYDKGDQIFEIIDGQQRLTTLRLMFAALDLQPKNQLTYRARKRSDDTLRKIPHFDKVEEKDIGIENGYKYVKTAIDDLMPDDRSPEKDGFISFLKNNVHIIRYRVPKDIDLNHYFEIMNSRGEQLEKHEIVKANLMEKLNNDEERKVFNRIWEACTEMSVYVQQNLEDLKPEDVFGNSLHDFCPKEFNDFLSIYRKIQSPEAEVQRTVTIKDIISSDTFRKWAQPKEDDGKKDSFLPIIDFPNFLLIVLKITRMEEADFSPIEFNLDDKELLNEFNNAKMDAAKVKMFAYILLKARFFLDNYIVHHSKEEDTIDNNPWKLQVWHKYEDARKGQLKNLSDDIQLQDQLTHLLSMFEVSFTARQRKNYLFYCLLYLMGMEKPEISAYARYVEELADRYFNQVYLDQGKLNAKNTPLPGSFDEVLLVGNNFIQPALPIKNGSKFNDIYGDGTVASKGLPLFVFNYLDYKLWKLYNTELRGEKLKEGSSGRRIFFDRLGCSDFGLKAFDQFYFSRTRRSLEHFYPQANISETDSSLDQAQINCFGNYAMIGSEANSSGSNWTPKTKLDHYLDPSGKISQVSVASLKFMIMMQMCKDNQKWDFDEIKTHQERMISLLTNDI